MPLTIACLGSTPSDLRAFLRDYSVSELNSGGTDLNGLLAELKRLCDLEFSAYARSNGLTFAPESGAPPVAFQAHLQAGDVIIIVSRFSLGALVSPSDFVVVQAFRKEGGRYVFAAETGNDLLGISAYRKITLLPAGSAAANAWLFIQGELSSFREDRERARIYSFDGYRFTTEWKPGDRLDMEITISGQNIDAQYMSEIPRFGGPIMNCMEEKLQLGTAGLIHLGIINHGERECLTAQ